MKDSTQLTVETTIDAPAEKVWKFWTEPEHIKNWNHASDDWYSPQASNDVWVGGKFSITMAAKDGSESFDFAGTYTKVNMYENLEYTLTDDRQVSITFTEQDNQTKVTEVFETENTNSIEMQQDGWQAILDNFKKYVEQQVK